MCVVVDALCRSCLSCEAAILGEASWVLSANSGNRDINRMDVPDGRQRQGHWVSDAAGPDGIYSKAHLFGSTNVEIAGTLTRTCDTSFPGRLRSCRHSICPLRRARRGQNEAQRWPSPDRAQLPCDQQSLREVCLEFPVQP